MKYNHYLKSKLENYEEPLWTFDHQAKDLQNERQGYRSLWEDEASRFINSRFLNPHEEDDANGREYLNQQVNAIQQLDSMLQQVQILREEILEISDSIAQNLDHIRKDLDKADFTFSTFLQSKGKMEDLLPEIGYWIAKANQTGT